jgi:SAM domain (Sterile alpha motif)
MYIRSQRLTNRLPIVADWVHGQDGDSMSTTSSQPRSSAERAFERRLYPLPTAANAIMDVVVWLRSLGLGKYEAIFRENDIDETVLPSLTLEHLKELGVASFGHRVKLLDRTYSNGGKPSNERPSNKDAACISRRSQPEPSNQMSQILS